MPERRNIEIQNNFELYQTVLNSDKHFVNGSIGLNEDPNHKTSKIGGEELENEHLDDIKFIARMHVLHNTKYNFGLRAVSLSQKPFFRFDSAGPSHRNRNSPLTEQSVTTPHFQHYDENGNNIAYKTDVLRDKEDEIIADINTGFEHFCEEGNCSHINGGRVIIEPSPGQIDFGIDVDPLSGISFN